MINLRRQIIWWSAQECRFVAQHQKARRRVNNNSHLVAIIHCLTTFGLKPIVVTEKDNEAASPHRNLI